MLKYFQHHQYSSLCYHSLSPIPHRAFIFHSYVVWKSKDKEKKEKVDLKGSAVSSDDVHTPDLVAILANQAVKEEKKRAGLKNKRKKEKIKTSEPVDFIALHKILLDIHKSSSILCHLYFVFCFLCTCAFSSKNAGQS